MVIYGENKAAARKLGTEPKKEPQEPQEAKKSPAKKK